MCPRLCRDSPSPCWPGAGGVARPRAIRCVRPNAPICPRCERGTAQRFKERDFIRTEGAATGLAAEAAFRPTVEADIASGHFAMITAGRVIAPLLFQVYAGAPPDPTISQKVPPISKHADQVHPGLGMHSSNFRLGHTAPRLAECCYQGIRPSVGCHPSSGTKFDALGLITLHL